jgi:N-acetylglucosamine kinase-like BadF-type ATPase
MKLECKNANNEITRYLKLGEKENYLDYVLGVDGGGTKTVAQIADLSGKMVAESESRSSNYKSVGIEVAKENINKAIFKAMEKINNFKKFTFKSACFGLSGNDSSEDRNIYHKIIFDSKIKDYLDPDNTIICNDTRIGLAAGSDSKNGIMIICGTGSNCFGINEEGKEVKVNGWDFILGDEGSGYEIGIKGLRALMRAYDGRGKSTLLSKTILEDLNIKNVSELIRWTYSGPFFKDKIAAVAKIVCRTAEMGDKISIKILKGEAMEAVNSVTVVANELNLADKKFDLVFVGNVFKCEKYFKNVLVDKLKEKFLKINLIPLTKKPVEGAIKLALRNL